MRWTGVVVLLWPALAAAKQPEWKARALRSGTVYVAPDGFSARDADGVVVADAASGARVTWQRANLDQAMSALGGISGAHIADDAATCAEEEAGGVRRALCVCEGERGQLVLGQLSAAPVAYRALGGVTALRRAAGVLAHRLSLVPPRVTGSDPAAKPARPVAPFSAFISGVMADPQGGSWLEIKAGSSRGVEVGWSGAILDDITRKPFAGLSVREVWPDHARAFTDAAIEQLSRSRDVWLSDAPVAFNPAYGPQIATKPAPPGSVRAHIIDMRAIPKGTVLTIDKGSDQGLKVGSLGSIVTRTGLLVGSVRVSHVAAGAAVVETTATMSAIGDNTRVTLTP